MLSLQQVLSCVNPIADADNHVIISAVTSMFGLIESKDQFWENYTADIQMLVSVDKNPLSVQNYSCLPLIFTAALQMFSPRKPVDIQLADCCAGAIVSFALLSWDNFVASHIRSRQIQDGLFLYASKTLELGFPDQSNVRYNGNSLLSLLYSLPSMLKHLVRDSCIFACRILRLYLQIRDRFPSISPLEADIRLCFDSFFTACSNIRSSGDTPRFVGIELLDSTLQPYMFKYCPNEGVCRSIDALETSAESNISLCAVLVTAILEMSLYHRRDSITLLLRLGKLFDGNNDKYLKDITVPLFLDSWISKGRRSLITSEIFINLLREALCDANDVTFRKGALEIVKFVVSSPDARECAMWISEVWDIHAWNTWNTIHQSLEQFSAHLVNPVFSRIISLYDCLEKSKSNEAYEICRMWLLILWRRIFSHDSVSVRRIAFDVLGLHLSSERIFRLQSLSRESNEVSSLDFEIVGLIISSLNHPGFQQGCTVFLTKSFKHIILNVTSIASCNIFHAHQKISSSPSVALMLCCSMILSAAATNLERSYSFGLLLRILSENVVEYIESNVSNNKAVKEWDVSSLNSVIVKIGTPGKTILECNPITISYLLLESSRNVLNCGVLLSSSLVSIVYNDIVQIMYTLVSTSYLNLLPVASRNDVVDAVLKWILTNIASINYCCTIENVQLKKYLFSVLDTDASYICNMTVKVFRESYTDVSVENVYRLGCIFSIALGSFSGIAFRNLCDILWNLSELLSNYVSAQCNIKLLPFFCALFETMSNPNEIFLKYDEMKVNNIVKKLYVFVKAVLVYYSDVYPLDEDADVESKSGIFMNAFSRIDYSKRLLDKVIFFVRYDEIISKYFSGFMLDAYHHDINSQYPCIEFIQSPISVENSASIYCKCQRLLLWIRHNGQFASPVWLRDSCKNISETLKAHFKNDDGNQTHETLFFGSRSLTLLKMFRLKLFDIKVCLVYEIMHLWHKINEFDNKSILVQKNLVVSLLETMYNGEGDSAVWSIKTLTLCIIYSSGNSVLISNDDLLSLLEQVTHVVLEFKHIRPNLSEAFAELICSTFSILFNSDINSIDSGFQRVLHKIFAFGGLRLLGNMTLRLCQNILTPMKLIHGSHVVNCLAINLALFGLPYSELGLQSDVISGSCKALDHESSVLCHAGHELARVILHLRVDSIIEYVNPMKSTAEADAVIKWSLRYMLQILRLHESNCFNTSVDVTIKYGLGLHRLHLWQLVANFSRFLSRIPLENFDMYSSDIDHLCTCVFECLDRKLYSTASRYLMQLTCINVIRSNVHCNVHQLIKRLQNVNASYQTVTSYIIIAGSLVIEHCRYLEKGLVVPNSDWVLELVTAVLPWAYHSGHAVRTGVQIILHEILLILKPESFDDTNQLVSSFSVVQALKKFLTTHVAFTKIRQHQTFISVDLIDIERACSPSSMFILHGITEVGTKAYHDAGHAEELDSTECGKEAFPETTALASLGSFADACFKISDISDFLPSSFFDRIKSSIKILNSERNFVSYANNTIHDAIDDKTNHDFQRRIENMCSNVYSTNMMEIGVKLGAAEIFLENLSASGKRQDVIVVGTFLDNLPNLAGLCRTSEIFQVGLLALPNLKVTRDDAFKRVSVTSENWQPLIEVPPRNLIEFLQQQRRRGYSIVGIEQTNNSVPLHQFKFTSKTVLVLGCEQTGIPAEYLVEMDSIVEIPQLGTIRSLNAHVSASIVIWEYSSQMSKMK